MTASTVNPAATALGWEPMRLDYLGQVGELMRATATGSKRDDPTKGCGSDRKKTGTGDPC